MESRVSAYELLVEIRGEVSATAARVESLRAELLGENGIIQGLRGAIERLDQRNEETRGQLRNCAAEHAESSKELAGQLQTIAGAAASWRERLSGGWGLVLVVAVLAALANDLIGAVRAAAHLVTK